eukprot:CAMPEP_0173398646 /NCGR_PEP_ID=MMETSP1356-20130122/42389_1 /TAXON_ID=77927 ORGANISM="Hemiselmis virescens, Strain PCC157" /NCGR_SAMPLE_ID=MMETSP1356 /ASSEMBLY_ACC=CAM_ASM_000847 /LENGTH=38 /DNA_ID= /DNA_START= /DNA_END= /DNA_ORIENTATION=
MKRMLPAIPDVLHDWNMRARARSAPEIWPIRGHPQMSN